MGGNAEDCEDPVGSEGAVVSAVGSWVLTCLQLTPQGDTVHYSKEKCTLIPKEKEGCHPI